PMIIGWRRTSRRCPALDDGATLSRRKAAWDRAVAADGGLHPNCGLADTRLQPLPSRHPVWRKLSGQYRLSSYCCVRAGGHQLHALGRAHDGIQVEVLVAIGAYLALVRCRTVGGALDGKKPARP
ncbi:MAG: hypothetical protein EBY18_19680, partial [Alphaproteobacteria bacterium]|nr:hypothetical protein [Alphaproteobacteria bacterium]